MIGKVFVAVMAVVLLMASASASGSEDWSQMKEQTIGKLREDTGESFICPLFAFDHGVMFKEFDSVGAFIYLMADASTLPMGSNLDFADVHFIVNPSSSPKEYYAQHNWRMDSSDGMFFTLDNHGEGDLRLAPGDRVVYFFTTSINGIACDSDWFEAVVEGEPIPAEFQVPMDQQNVQDPQQNF